jgi:hypothetical protein
MRLQIAKMMSVTRLYHYQPFRPEWLEATVLHDKVHCTGPRDFNDPWDCRPCYDESVLDDPKVYDQHVLFFDRVDRKYFSSKTEEQRAQQLQRMRTDPAFLRSLLRQMEGIDEAIHKEYRIFCLASKPDSIVMWSHYANKHRGVCLEFSTDAEEFSGAYRVIYSERYPLFNLADDDPANNLLPLVTKAAAWSYEEEYRVIAEVHATARSDGSLHTHENFLTIPPSSLKSVILGCEMGSSSRESVRDIVKRSGKAISVRQAVRIANHYTLTITD